jgi:NAD(P)-dependent dehydrogenase (short-subunit alcohol dehydrogenase family)
VHHVSLSDFSKPIAIVTGANRGIGKPTAQGLAELGYRTVLMGRDASGLKEVAAEINEASSGSLAAVIEVDLASQKSIRGAAKVFLNNHQRLDVLVNNAAVVSSSRCTTEDGFELQLAVNHLAPFLLTNLLLPALKASAPSRIVTVSSHAHFRGQINLNDIHLANGYSGKLAYRQSKLANVFFTLEMAKQIEGTGVTANCLHPGLITTNVLGGLSRLPSWLRWVLRPFTVSPELGARCTLQVATDPSLADYTGEYFVNGKPQAPNPIVHDQAISEKLWKLSAQLTGLTP